MTVVDIYIKGSNHGRRNNMVDEWMSQKVNKTVHMWFNWLEAVVASGKETSRRKGEWAKHGHANDGSITARIQYRLGSETDTERYPG